MIACPSARRASSQYASQRAATLNRMEMQGSVSDDTFRTLTAEDRETLSAPVPADAPYPSPVCTSVLNEEPEAPAVRKTEMEAEEPEAPAACKTEMEAEPAPLAALSDDLSTHLLSTAPAAPSALSTDEQIVSAVITTASERHANSNDCFSNRSYTEEQWAGARALARLGVTQETLLTAAPTLVTGVFGRPAPSLVRLDVPEPAAGGGIEEAEADGTRDPRPASDASSLSPCCASIEELEAPATLKTEMEAEPAPAYDVEQARLEAVEKMRLWHAERDAALPARSARLAIVARAVTNLHGKHGEWDIMDEPDEGWNAPTVGKTPPPAIAKPVKLAEAVFAPPQGEVPHRVLRTNSKHGVRIAIVDNDYDSSSSARSTHAGPTDGKECHFQNFLSCFMAPGMASADDAASYDDVQEILGCFIASGTAGADDSASNDDAPEELDFGRLATELVTIDIPPGPVGLVLGVHEDGFHTTVTSVRATSPVSGSVLTGDIMHTLDGVNVSNLFHTEVTKLIRGKMLQQRSLVVKRPTCASIDTTAAAPNRPLPPCFSMRTTGHKPGLRRLFDGATDSKRVLGKATMGQTQLIG